MNRFILSAIATVSVASLVHGCTYYDTQPDTHITQPVQPVPIITPAPVVNYGYTPYPTGLPPVIINQPAQPRVIEKTKIIKVQTPTVNTVPTPSSTQPVAPSAPAPLPVPSTIAVPRAVPSTPFVPPSANRSTFSTTSVPVPSTTTATPPRPITNPYSNSSSSNSNFNRSTTVVPTQSSSSRSSFSRTR